MFINLLISAKEIRQNIEKSTYHPSCKHSLKTPADFPLTVFGSQKELDLLQPAEPMKKQEGKRKSRMCPLEDEDLGIEIDDVWIRIYTNSLNCGTIRCDCSR